MQQDLRVSYRYWFGLARKFIFSFFRGKIERRAGILLGDKAGGYGGGGGGGGCVGRPSNRLNITKFVLKAKKKGKTLLSRKLICRCLYCLKIP
jgi:hypothetical protein